MKGRITSFQRFGSSLGTTGSVLHKFIRSLGNAGVNKGRDRELLGDGPDGVDESDGKGIYNKTVKSGDDLKYDFEEKDNFGEEVYGCIAKPFGKDAVQEKDSETAINCRKATINDSPHYEENKRKWYHVDAKKSHEDYAAIPQENLPLTVNSKFPMKYYSRSGMAASEEDLEIDIPKGIGFTSGALIRPLRFTETAVQMKNGYASLFSGLGGLKEGQPIPAPNLHYAHILEAVPLETAHKMINCCKEIVLTGSVLHSIQRSNKKCEAWDGGDGPDKSNATAQGEENSSLCPPGECTPIYQEFTATCASGKQTTRILLDGDLKMTAYRYKQAADVWEKKEKQKTLDISGNAFFGGLEDAALRKLTIPYCLFPDGDGESPPPKLPDPTLKQVYVFQKQTKLSSGCLPYPMTNNSMLVASEDQNMKSSRFENPDCEPNTAINEHFLESTASPHTERQLATSTICYEGGQILRNSNNADTFVRPLHVSGPSLFCSFNGIGWDYNQIGKDTPETLWKADKCGKLGVHHKDWKMNWNSTGIKTTFTGKCPQGFAPLDRYNTKINTCECPSNLDDCGSDYGELKLICTCQGTCYAPPEGGNPCQEGMLISSGTPPEESCDGTYGITFAIGKYVGHYLDSYNDIKYYETAPVPLKTKVDDKAEPTEDLTLWFSGFISDVLPSYFYRQTPSLGGLIFLSSETAQKNKPEDNSIYRYETRQVGTLTITCEDWQDTAEIWVVLSIEKENECKTNASPFVGPALTNGGINVQYAYELGEPSIRCNECGTVEGQTDFCCEDGGCNGVADQLPCCDTTARVIDDPCDLSFTISGATKECARNSETTCGGQCILEDSEWQDECGCCQCGLDEEDYDCDKICEPFSECSPVKYTQFQNLSCYGSAHEEDKHQFTLDLAIEFKLLTEME